MTSDLRSVCLVLVYFGHWPEWLNLTIESCRHNPTIDFLYITDCGPIDNKPPNLRIVESDLKAFNQLASEKLELDIRLDEPYKLVDLKPAFGVIFEDLLQEFDFWGNTDLDVVYGDLRNFLTPDVLESFDVISARSEYLAGHMTLYRNSPSVNRLYRQSTDYPRIFTESEVFSFAECGKLWRHLHNGGSIFDKGATVDKLQLRNWPAKADSMTHIASRLARDKRLKVWMNTQIQDRPECLGNYWQLEWNKGELRSTESGEPLMYFHMVGTRDHADFRVPDWHEIPSQYFISSQGFSLEPRPGPSFFDRLLKVFPPLAWLYRWKKLPY